MRTPLLALVLVSGLLLAPAVMNGPAIGSDTQAAFSAVVLAQQQPPSADIDVNLRTDDAWYTNPLWIAVGVVALLVIVALIVAAGRGGGGTTIVRG